LFVIYFNPDFLHFRSIELPKIEQQLLMLQKAKRENSIVCSTPEAIKSLMLKYVESVSSIELVDPVLLLPMELTQSMSEGETMTFYSSDFCCYFLLQFECCDFVSFVCLLVCFQINIPMGMLMPFLSLFSVSALSFLSLFSRVAADGGMPAKVTAKYTEAQALKSTVRRCGTRA
jgi:hypothetical protein